MLFGSLEFVFGFLPIALLAYHLLRVRGWQVAAKLAMVLASLVFYGWWDPRYILLVLGSIAVNYGLGAVIHRTPAAGPRKAVLVLGASRPRPARANCGSISLWWVIGPAIRCGKNSTNSR